MTDLPLWRARATDPETSHAAARSPSMHSDCERLLVEFRRAGARGLTDSEAAERAGLLASGYWKRCSDLRSLGLIEFTSETRIGRSGRAQTVSRRTEARRA